MATSDNPDRIALENEKLRLEIETLRQGTKPKRTSASTWVSLSVSVVTAIAAVTGIMMSNRNQQVADARAEQSAYNQSLQAARTAHNQSLQTALSMATDNAGGSARRISGIYQLEQFWRQPGRSDVNDPAITPDQRSVGSALGALLLVPDSAEGARDVRCSAAQVIGAAYENLVGNFQQPDDPKWVPMRRFLFGTGSAGVWGVVSRANALAAIHAAKSTLDASASSKPVISTPVIEQAPAANAVSPIQKTIACETTQDATKEAIRKSWSDLRDTSLQNTDLSLASLYEADLHAANLNQANLQGTNLRCANLSNADLRSANLTGAHIELANLNGATMGTQVADLDQPDQTLDISDAQWLEWKRGRFTLAKLKEIMGKSFPAWAEGQPDFCQ